MPSSFEKVENYVHLLFTCTYAEIYVGTLGTQKYSEGFTHIMLP